jgi:hypothetical protein
MVEADKKVETDDEANAEWLKQIEAALDKRHFDLAFRLSQRRIIDEAMRWFREDDIAFKKPEGEISGRELIVSLSIAARKAVETRGENASVKIMTAAHALHAVALLRISLEPDWTTLMSDQPLSQPASPECARAS